MKNLIAITVIAVGMLIALSNCRDPQTAESVGRIDTLTITIVDTVWADTVYDTAWVSPQLPLAENVYYEFIASGINGLDTLGVMRYFGVVGDADSSYLLFSGHGFNQSQDIIIKAAQ